MNQEVETLISLLEDNDSEVLFAVTRELLKQGIQIIPELEKAWELASNQTIQERLENVIHHIQFSNTRDKLKNWLDSGAENILEGATYVAQFQFPYADYNKLDTILTNISNDIYLSKGSNLSAAENVKLLNYVIYELNNFNRNTSNFYSPHNSYINQVIETRKGNPISLGIVYLVIAEKLGLPICGVNLPKSFILAYMNEYRQYDSTDSSKGVLFYINPYNKGTILNKKEVDYFIEQQGLKKLPEYYNPCDNKSIILRLLTNLIIAYQKLGFEGKIRMLQDILHDISKNMKIN
jgi:regulator of sirC expression with transglutaminase-like and TPR domain